MLWHPLRGPQVLGSTDSNSTRDDSDLRLISPVRKRTKQDCGDTSRVSLAFVFTFGLEC